MTDPSRDEISSLREIVQNQQKQLEAAKNLLRRSQNLLLEELRLVDDLKEFLSNDTRSEGA